MQASEVEQFQSMLHGIGEYYGKDISDTLMEIYWEGLRQYGYAALSKAAQLHMKNPDNGQFFPKIADFERYLGGTNTDKAMLAWTLLDKAVRSVGPYRTVVFDDPAIHAVIADMGGWVAFGSVTDDEWPFKQNEFVKRYRGYAERGGGFVYPAKLKGIADIHNEAIGKISDKDTVLIGDQRRALGVLEGGKDGSPLMCRQLADIDIDIDAGAGGRALAVVGK